MIRIIITKLFYHRIILFKENKANSMIKKELYQKKLL